MAKNKQPEWRLIPGTPTTSCVMHIPSGIHIILGVNGDDRHAWWTHRDWTARPEFVPSERWARA